MNSPRDPLLRRHASVVPRLDELRGRLVAEMAASSAALPRRTPVLPTWQRFCLEFLGFGPRTAAALGAIALLAAGLEFASRRPLTLEAPSSGRVANRAVPIGLEPVLTVADTLRERGKVLEAFEGGSEPAGTEPDPAVPVGAGRRPMGTRSQAPARVHPHRMA